MKSTSNQSSASSSTPSDETKATNTGSGSSAQSASDTQTPAQKTTAPTATNTAQTTADKTVQTSSKPQSAPSEQNNKNKTTTKPEAQRAPAPQPVEPPAAKPQPAAVYTAPPASHGFLPIFSLLLATGAIVCAVMMWQRMGQMEQQLNLSLQQGSSTSETARTLAQQSLDASYDMRGRLSAINTRIEALNEQSSHIDMLMQYVNNAKTETLPSDFRTLLQSAQLQTQLTGSVEPLLITLQSIDERLEHDSLSAQTPLRQAIAQDIDNIRNAAVPDPMRLSLQISELIGKIDQGLPLLIEPAQSQQQTTTVASAPSPETNTAETAPHPTQNETGTAAEGFSADQALDYLKRSWDWTSTKATEVGTTVWSHLGSLVQVRPITNRNAMLITPQEGNILRENIKLRLLSIRISILQRQYTYAQQDLDEVITALQTYFYPENRNVQELLQRLETIRTNLQNMSTPQPSATLSALTNLEQR